MVPTFNSNIALSADGTHLRSLHGRARSAFDGWTASRASRSRSPKGGLQQAPLFSPDGKFVSVIDGNELLRRSSPFLKVLPVRRTRDQALSDYDNFHSGAWADDGLDLLDQHYPGGIVRMRDSGGPIETVTELDVKKGERSHRFAHLLPGGQALIYTVAFAGISEL